MGSKICRHGAPQQFELSQISEGNKIKSWNLDRSNHIFGGMRLPFLKTHQHQKDLELSKT